MSSASFKSEAHPGKSSHGYSSKLQQARWSACIDKQRCRYIPSQINRSFFRVTSVHSGVSSDEPPKHEGLQSENIVEQKLKLANTASTRTSTIRAIAFYAWTLCLVLVLLPAIIITLPLVSLFDPRRRLFDRLAKWWGMLSCRPFFQVDVQGAMGGHEEGPCVFVCNHQSWLDIFAVYHIPAAFKIVARDDVAFSLPLIAQACTLIGHIPVVRGSVKSQRDVLHRCRAYLARGVSVLFFAEGKLSPSRCLGTFQRGAFKIACDADVPIVPVSIIGTGRMLPASSELTLRAVGDPGVCHLRLVQHAPLLPHHHDGPDALRDAAHAAVASVLPSQSDEAAFDALW
eukprot:CAMPEP_0196665536 /NCGR_PEP_ID=MMETSP1086-20130531/61470_1 /TAXON_ID=77921 /ORGANISM="Cyanoptyche  gloeocystis , Strain SAG4.97" /LENGTH=342 /DNA_ID=CAMNT_0042002345 /DNA_START=120 /DNA_END=1146 /DNA_ORIENTATION=-